MNRIEKLKESIRFIKERGIESTEFGIILGTGLGGLVEKIKPIIVLDYGEIPHLPLTTVSYHKGKLIYGTLFGKKVLVFDGRFHLYEGYDFFEITYPVRIMKLLGVQNLVISNAAGAINLEFKKGEILGHFRGLDQCCIPARPRHRHSCVYGPRRHSAGPCNGGTAFQICLW